MSDVVTFANEYTVCRNGNETGRDGYLVTFSCRGWAIRVRDMSRICWSEKQQEFYWDPQNSDKTNEYFEVCRYKDLNEALKIAQRLILENKDKKIEYKLWVDSAPEGEKIEDD